MKNEFECEPMSFSKSLFARFTKESYEERVEGMQMGIGMYELLILALVGFGCLGAICIPVVLILLATSKKRRSGDQK